MAKQSDSNFWLKETAESFGMRIDKFASFIGYSRQMLYQVSDGSAKSNPGRVAVAIYKLETLSDKLLEADIESAKASHQKRKILLDDLQDRLEGK